jgi:septal ring factor EnvC (AmiA/AmiB activator)
MGADQHYAIWKNVSMFLSGIVVSLIVMWATYVRSAVSRDEMENYVTQRISTMDKQIAELNKNVIELKEATAGLKAELAAGRR